jgi:hypothetical protein
LEQVKSSKHKLALENLNQSLLSATTLNNIGKIHKKNNIPTKQVDEISRFPLKRTHTLHNKKMDFSSFNKFTPNTSNASPNSSFVAPDAKDAEQRRMSQLPIIPTAAAISQQLFRDSFRECPPDQEVVQPPAIPVNKQKREKSVVEKLKIAQEKL